MKEKCLCMRLILIFFVFAGMTQSISAQELNAKEHVKLGEELYASGDYLKSADHFFKAWEMKQNKYAWLYQAGLAYHYVSDYANASKAFSVLKEKSSKYPDAQLLLARNLKNEGKYQEASKEFLDYIYEYDGDDKEELSVQLQREIRGCELGLQMQKADFDSGIEIQRIDQNVNSIADESNPIPFDRDVLYFVSDFAGNSKFYRTEYQNGTWQKAIDPPLFPRVNDVDIKNGTFSPDFKRFYFNLCEDAAEEEYGQCDLYFITKDGDAWSEPQKMKKYINIPGTSNMHPHVVYLDDKEIIYFSSNRSGGYGGLDLWYIVRDRASNITEYTFPTNLGKAINSDGDEIAPYYKMNEGRLYFSSNGKITMGGYDIFRAKGSEAFWESAENVGSPINSSADDFQISWNVGGSMGYLVSNRSDARKAATSEYDIFAFETGNVVDKLLLVGSIFDESNNRIVTDAHMALFVREDGKNMLVQKLRSEKGDFKFWLDPDKDYYLKTSKEDYLTRESRFSTRNLGGAVEFEQNIYLVEGVESNDLPPSEIPENTVASNEIRREVPIQQNVPKQEPVVQSSSTTKTPVRTTPSSSSTSTPARTTPSSTTSTPVRTTTSSTANNQTRTTSSTTTTTGTTRPPSSTTTQVRSNDPERRTNNNTVEIEPVNNKTVRITQPAQPAASSNNQPARTTSTYRDNTARTEDGRIVDARPVDPKKVEIVTSGNPQPVTYPSTTSTTNVSSRPSNSNSYYSSSSNRVGVSYKIQICSLSKFDANNPAFSGVKSLGNLETEFLSGRNLTRVLIGSYPSRSQAEEAARSAKVNGFGGAFVVEYLDGKRLN